jgi:hypothetical protein
VRRGHDVDRWVQPACLLCSNGRGVDIAWTIVGQAGQVARDPEVIDIVARGEGGIATQVRFLHTRLKQAAPQALLVAE